MNKISMHLISKTLTKSAILAVALLGFTGMAAADDSPTQTIAMVISHLNHFPSADEKKTLAAISDDDEYSDATRTLAGALSRVQHKASAEDVAALQKIVDESESSDAEKKLAKIIMGINHKPSADDLAVLETLK